MDHPILMMLKSYFQNESPELDTSVESILVTKAKEQALQPFLYYVYGKEQYKSYYITASIVQEGYIKLQKEITALFNASHIKHLYFKGSVLYTLYPDPALRTRGDIDVYVDSSKFSEAKTILLQEGYTLLSIDSQHHIEFMKNHLIVELHYMLFDDFRAISYFKDPFSLSNQQEQYLYAFTNENHFLYCLHHFAIHLRLGAGVRYLLDFYYMLKKWDMDKTILHRLIQQEDYMKLYHNILNAIYVLSKEELDDFPKEDVSFFLEYLIQSGIHGFGEENKREEKGFGIKNQKWKAIFSGTFMLNKTFRIAKYPKLGKHWFTYPLCLIHRIFYLLFTQTRRVWKLLFSKKNKVTKKEKEFYKALGIK